MRRKSGPQPALGKAAELRVVRTQREQPERLGELAGELGFDDVEALLAAVTAQREGGV